LAAIQQPYPGLRAFETYESFLFFGREIHTEELLRRLSGNRFLAVVGTSGGGKSSLVRAGLLPALYRGYLVGATSQWRIAVMRPGGAPISALAAALADAEVLGTEDDPARQKMLRATSFGLVQAVGSAALRQRESLLLVVDQFEQLFAQCPDEQQRQAFITALHAAATAGHGPEQAPAALVVLGVRADFEARCADYPQLAGAVQDRYLVTAMTERQLRMAITEPAKKAGSRVDGDLAEVLLREVHTRHRAVSGAGVLPLLSHVLDQAWRSRTGDVLTLADYERTGGIEGALAGSAQRATRL